MDNLKPIIITIICFAAGWYVFVFNMGKYNYEGATEPGNPYPEEAREKLVEDCILGMKQGQQENNSPGAKLSGSQLAEACECIISEFENDYSYKQFDKEIDTYMTGMRAEGMGFIPKEIKSVFNRCIKKYGLFIW